MQHLRQSILLIEHDTWFLEWWIGSVGQHGVTLHHFTVVNYNGGVSSSTAISGDSAVSGCGRGGHVSTEGGSARAPSSNGGKLLLIHGRVHFAFSGRHALCYFAPISHPVVELKQQNGKMPIPIDFYSKSDTTPIANFVSFHSRNVSKTKQLFFENIW